MRVGFERVFEILPFRNGSAGLRRSAFHVNHANRRIDYFQAKGTAVVGSQPFAGLRGNDRFVGLKTFLRRGEIHFDALLSAGELDLLRGHDAVAAPNLHWHNLVRETRRAQAEFDAGGGLVRHSPLDLHIFQHNVLWLLRGAEGGGVNGDAFSAV